PFRQACGISAVRGLAKNLRPVWVVLVSGSRYNRPWEKVPQAGSNRNPDSAANPAARRRDAKSFVDARHRVGATPIPVGAGRVSSPAFRNATIEDPPKGRVAGTEVQASGAKAQHAEDEYPARPADRGETPDGTREAPA